MEKILAGKPRKFIFFLILGALLSAASSAASAQVAPLAPKWLAGTSLPPVETFADGLTRHHIDLTEAALLTALRDPDGDVRSLAAAQLAAMDDRPALTAILVALESEIDLQVQVNLAGAATWLGSQRALDRLQRLCQNINVPAASRLDAARYVSNKNLPTCYSSVEQIEQTDQDPNIRVLAITAAVNYRGQSDKPKLLAISALSDSAPMVRIAAADTLRYLHATDAVATLRHALEIDGDDTVRDYLREAIRDLSVTEKEP